MNIYLGSVLTEDEKCDTEKQWCIGKLNATFQNKYAETRKNPFYIS